MWEKELNVARRAAEESGRVLSGLFGKVNHVHKKGAIDLVTEADLESEKVILDIIGNSFPGDGILTEEGGEYGRGSERVWIIDPLDGTTNFAHSFPFFAVSIAFQVDRETVLGVVFNPRLDELFEALKGKGAYLNEKPVKVSGTLTLGESLVATGFPYSIYKDPEQVIELLKKMVTLVQGVRRAGAAAIDLCYVATGRLDGFWEEGLKPWDTAAGSLIVREAGGLVCDFSGAPYTPFQDSIVAANPHIFQYMVEALKESRLPHSG